MNKTFLMILALVAVATIGYFFWPSDEARVKEAFREVAAALEKNGSENNLEAIQKAKRAVAFVEPGCSFELVLDGGSKTFILSKVAADITQQVVAYRMNVSNIHVSFEDLTVTFPDKTTAEVTCDFFYQGDDFGWSVRDARALEATLRKDPESGRWRFARVRVSNIIEK